MKNNYRKATTRGTINSTLPNTGTGGDNGFATMLKSARDRKMAQKTAFLEQNSPLQPDALTPDPPQKQGGGF